MTLDRGSPRSPIHLDSARSARQVVQKPQRSSTRWLWPTGISRTRILISRGRLFQMKGFDGGRFRSSPTDWLPLDLPSGRRHGDKDRIPRKAYTCNWIKYILLLGGPRRLTVARFLFLARLSPLLPMLQHHRLFLFSRHIHDLALREGSQLRTVPPNVAVQIAVLGFHRFFSLVPWIAQWVHFDRDGSACRSGGGGRFTVHPALSVHNARECLW
jgi:hypothetical protein